MSKFKVLTERCKVCFYYLVEDENGRYCETCLYQTIKEQEACPTNNGS